MISYADVKASNAKITSDLPRNLVAVFIGGTNGIGEYTLRQFAKHAVSPRVYIVGRSQEAATRIIADCNAFNMGGTFTFIKEDTSVIRNVDRVCDDLKAKESSINLLVISIGTLNFTAETSDGILLATALVHHCRARFILNLLPQLRSATSLKRVVSIFTATKEGPFDLDDMHGRNLSLMKVRGHAASLVTMHMMQLARQAPDVSFVHTFPGPVKSGIARDMPGILGYIARTLGFILAPFFYINPEESGAYHLFFSTSDRYPAKDITHTAQSSISLKGIDVAKGIDGNPGTGMYSIDQNGATASKQVEDLISKYEQDGTADRMWQSTRNDWEEILKRTTSK